MNYESPLKVICTELATKIKNQVDENIWQAIQRVGIDVDKDELIRALQYDRDQYQKGYNDGYEDGLNADKWISVEYMMPDNEQDVLAYLDDGEETRVAHCNYANGVWYDCVMNCVVVLHHITHWMPLPEPPKEG